MDEILSSQKSILGIDEFLTNSKTYIADIFPNLNMEDLLSSSLKGSISTNFWTSTFLQLASFEVKQAISLLSTVLIVIIIHTILKSIVESMGNLTTSRIVYIAQYLVIVTLITESFANVVNITKDSIKNISDFMNLLIPILSTLMLTTGKITTVNVIQPILLITVTAVGNFINSFVIPFLLISVALSIVSNISDKVQLNNLSRFMKSSIVWILGIVLTIFVCLLSLEGTLSSGVDGLTAKTAKAAVSTFIPVVGKIMGDSVDTIIGCGNILKNAIGIIGIIVIFGIVISPLIKVGILWAIFCLLSAICETIADEKIVRLFKQISDSYKILLGTLFSVSAMFIIGITIVIKMTS